MGMLSVAKFSKEYLTTEMTTALALRQGKQIQKSTRDKGKMTTLIFEGWIV